MTPMFGIMASQITGHLVTSSFESIATLTGSGGTTLTFSSIPSTYKSLQLRFMFLTGTPGSGAYAWVNGDTASNYSFHALENSTTSVVAAGVASTSSPNITPYNQGMSSGASYPNVGIIDFIDYASTSKYKTMRQVVGSNNNDSFGAISLQSWSWRSTSAINSITLFTGATFPSGSVFALYGVKG